MLSHTMEIRWRKAHSLWNVRDREKSGERWMGCEENQNGEILGREL